MPSEPSRSGIVTDENSGERHIPASLRADGTTRKAIKVRPGYRPPEDVEIYKNRTAEGFRNRGKSGIPGAEASKSDEKETPSPASNKNAKRREARKKAKSASDPQGGTPSTTTPASNETKTEELDAEAEREKKARNLKKKLKQAKDLKNKKEGGESLLPEQIAKVIKINELIRELEALGFDADGEPKAAATDVAGEESLEKRPKES